MGKGAAANGYGLQSLPRQYRLGLANAGFTPRSFGSEGAFPCAVVKARLSPAVGFVPRVIEAAAAQVVKHYRRSGGLDAVIRFYRLAVKLQRKGKPRRASERGYIKIPDLTAGRILHTVAELEAEHVFTLGKVLGEVVFIIINYIVGV